MLSLRKSHTLTEDGTSMNLTQDEYNTCIETIRTVTDKLGADFANIDELNTLDPTAKPANSSTSDVYHLMIRKRPQSVQDLLEIRVAVVGNVDAGKSTMLGVLTKGVLDDGRGKARVNLFRHKHEIESGRTSSVGGEILGFDATSRPILQTGKKASWEEITDKAAKVLSFVDLAGHEKYLKTTVFGMTGSAPEFAMLMVGANAGMIGMSKEHLGLALSLGIPVLVVITKIDRCPTHVLDKTIKELTSILKSKSCRKIPLFVENNHDVVMTAVSSRQTGSQGSLDSQCILIQTIAKLCQRAFMSYISSLQCHRAGTRFSAQLLEYLAFPDEIRNRSAFPFRDQ